MSTRKMMCRQKNKLNWAMLEQAAVHSREISRTNKAFLLYLLMDFVKYILSHLLSVCLREHSYAI